MKDCNKCLKSFLRITGGGTVVIFGILSILGSGGGGNDVSSIPSGTTPSSIKAFNFNAGNSMAAAQVAASTMAFFSDFSTLGQTILTTLAASSPANSPFDLALCMNTGASKLSWIDSDQSGDMSIGDSATLQFTNCDLDGSGATTAGTAKLGVTSVDTDPLPNSVGLNVAVNVTITDTPDTTTYIANFAETSSTADNTNFTNVYTANDTSAQHLTVAKNGSMLYEFGCFTVTRAFSLADSTGTYKLQPGGVFNVTDAIMSFAGAPDLSFISEQMEAGTKRLLSLSVPECATLGVPNGVSDSDGSYIEMEALGGGNMRLHTFDATNVEQSTIDTTWDALLI
jgi:hypothetical protein